MARALNRWAIFICIAILFIYVLVSYSSLAEYGSLLGFGDNLPEIRSGVPSRDKFRKWRLIKTHFPVPRYIHQPGEAEAHVPRLQHDFSKYHESDIHKTERQRRRQAVREAFDHSWRGYTKHAWRHDEVMPISGGSRDAWGAWGATLVDSLDSLWIMGLDTEFETAVGELRKIDFTESALEEINVFETTIRFLGGLLGAYDLTGKKYNVLLHKAIELGEMLYHAFDTPNHMPLTRWKWKVAETGVEEQEASTDVIVAEIGSLTLEFTRLTQLTGDKKYFDVVQRVMDRFRAEQNETNLPGLWPLRVNARDGNFHDNDAFTMGGQADSLYEYLPKQYLLLQGRDNDYKDMYEYALDTAKTYLAFEPLIPLQSDDASAPAKPPSPPDRGGKQADLSKAKAKRDYDFSPDYSNPILLGTATSHSSTSSVHLTTLGQHLSCYAGGMIALSARAFAPFHRHEITEENLDLAERLVAGCVWSYRATPSKLGPELYVSTPCRKGRAAITSGEERDWTGVEPGKCRWDREKWVRAVRTHHTSSRDPAQLALDESSDSDFWENEIKRLKLTEGFVEVVDGSYKLRPEAVESLFVLWRVTGNPKYQDIAWEMFEAIDRIAKTRIAYATVANVMDNSHTSRKRAEENVEDVQGQSEEHSEADDQIHSEGTISRIEKRKRPKKTDSALIDSMESFWTAETLKYLYLTFAEPSVISLDEYVLNTEGHPFRWRKGPPPPGKNNG